ncbi:MAG: peptidase C26 [Nitrospina sp.]|nr:peptidase C26 [Nitrospina sp.]|tara:strand:+ start:2989 stop:3642 length:654 start_codon:yes stop_codon:yes gene_type:complete
MQKPKIGISLRVVDAPNYDEKRDALSHDWPTLLENLGLNPIYIPNTLKHVDEFFSEMSLNGLILSGGDDIGENLDRDETENLLLKLAIEKQIPIFGVCRGMQLINNYFGGNISVSNSNDHISKNHDVDITNQNFSSLFNTNKITVNSYHRNTIQMNQIGNDLNPFAISKSDKTIEGFFHTRFPIIGVMWHPERSKPFNDSIMLAKIFRSKIFWTENH